MNRRPLLLLALLALAGCGGGDEGGDRPGPAGGSPDPPARGAGSPSSTDFPPVRGRSLKELSARLPAVQVGMATSVHTPGSSRLAFGMIDSKRAFVYGESAVYLARDPDRGRAIGPFPAPADSLEVAPPFRSRGSASEEIAAIYDARVRFPSPGPWYVLAVTRNRGTLYGAATRVDVTAEDPIPAPGEPAPRVKTDTLASAGGDIASIETRVPPDGMHEQSFREVAGKRPVALLFATPRLCQSRVCGPVVDIAAQLERKYGGRMEFIHQEVFVDNDMEKGLRPPLSAFELRSEPWLFTVDREGRVAARLEGSFGVRAFEEAVQAAL